MMINIIKKLKNIFKFPPSSKEFIFYCECGEEFNGTCIDLAIKHEIQKKHKLVKKIHKSQLTRKF